MGELKGATYGVTRPDALDTARTTTSPANTPIDMACQPRPLTGSALRPGNDQDRERCGDRELPDAHGEDTDDKRGEQRQSPTITLERPRPEQETEHRQCVRGHVRHERRRYAHEPGKGEDEQDTTKTAEAIPTKRRASRYVDAIPIEAMVRPNAMYAQGSPRDSHRNGWTSAIWPTADAVCPEMSTTPVRTGCPRLADRPSRRCSAARSRRRRPP